jgi:hypothetical protein
LPAAQTTRTDKVINLIPLIDPAVGAAAGTWRFENGDLVSDGSAPATLEIAYQPLGEYDFRIEFTPEHVVQQHVSFAGTSFAWAMGVNDRCGFEYLDGKHMYDSPEARDGALAPGVRHVSVVRVRKDRVQGFLNGRLVCDVVTDYKNLSRNPQLGMRNGLRLGVGTWEKPARFHKIEVTELNPAAAEQTAAAGW